jgi:hypothetical protein
MNRLKVYFCTIEVICANCIQGSHFFKPPQTLGGNPCAWKTAAICAAITAYSLKPNYAAPKFLRRQYPPLSIGAYQAKL